MGFRELTKYERQQNEANKGSQANQQRATHGIDPETCQIE